MGMQSIHGEVATVNASVIPFYWEYPSPTPWGDGYRVNQENNSVAWPNRVTGSRTQMTFVSTMLNLDSSTTQSVKALIFTRSAGISATGTYTSLDPTPRRWSSSWNDESATWSSTSGPVINTTDEMLAIVFTGSQIEWWVNGMRASTQSYTATSIDFSSCTTWWTGDDAGNKSLIAVRTLHYIYDRALSAVEIAELWADPFCFVRS
jgi:hypothetical protein